MGYFSNGTEGDMYEAEYCDHCVHSQGRECPVLLAHLLWNYDECNNKASILHKMIPRDAEGWNQQCFAYVKEE